MADLPSFLSPNPPLQLPGGLVKDLVGMGWSPNAAAGIAGNIQQESGGKSWNIGDYGTSGGLFQEHGPRFYALEEYAASRNRSWRDPRTQLEFATSEARKMPGFMGRMNSLPPREAALLWSSQFERPNPYYANNPARERYAEQAAGKYGGGAGGGLPSFLTAQPSQTKPANDGLPSFLTAQPPSRLARPTSMPPPSGPIDPSIIARQKQASVAKARATDPWKPDTTSPEAVQASSGVPKRALARPARPVTPTPVPVNPVDRLVQSATQGEGPVDPSIVARAGGFNPQARRGQPAHPGTPTPKPGVEDPSITARQGVQGAKDPWRPDTTSPEARQTSGSIADEAKKVWNSIKDPGFAEGILNWGMEKAGQGIHNVVSRIARQPFPGLAPQLGMSETAANQLGRDVNLEIMRRGGEGARPPQEAIGSHLGGLELGRARPELALPARPATPTPARPELAQPARVGTQTPPRPELTPPARPATPTPAAHEFRQPLRPGMDPSLTARVAEAAGVHPEVMHKHLGGTGPSGVHIEDHTIAAATAEKTTQAATDSPFMRKFKEKERVREPQALGAQASPDPEALPDRPSKQFIRDEEDNFNRLRQGATADKAELDGATQPWPDILKNNDVQVRLRRRKEGEKGVYVSPEEDAAYQRHQAPMEQEVHDWYEEFKDKDIPVDPEHVHRMVRGLSPEFDRYTGAAAGGPLGEGSYKSTRKPSSLQERVYHVMEDDQGNREVVAKLPGGEWTTVGPNAAKLKPQTYQGLNPPQKVGDKFRLGDKSYTVRNARISEIEAATDVRYHGSLAAITTNELIHLRALGRNLYNLDRLKQTPEFQKYATNDERLAPKRLQEGWKHVDMPTFRGYVMDPKLKYVIDDFWGHRGDDPLAALAKINRSAVRTLFWSPIPHILNVGYHWTTARGWDWLPHQWIPLAQTFAKALKEVYTQGPELQRVMREGSGMVYAGLRQEQFYRTILNRFGENIKREPWRWDPIARMMGYGPSDLVRMVYGASSHALWSVSDAMLLQRTFELERKGMSTRAAVHEAERHIPNYRIPSEVAGSRILSQVLQNSALTEFSRYHYGMVMSHARMIGDLVGRGKTPKERFDAVGNMFVTGLLMYYLAPAVNYQVQKLSGNKNLSMGPKGSTTVPQMLVDMYNGDKDFIQAIGQIVTLAPLFKTGMEALTNTDFFTGRRIVEPADLKSAARGDVKGIARSVAQEGEHLAGKLVAPYGVAEQARSVKEVGTDLAKQGLGLREAKPGKKAKGKKYETAEQKARQKHPRGYIEEGARALERSRAGRSIVKGVAEGERRIGETAAEAKRRVMEAEQWAARQLGYGGTQ